MGRKTLQTDNPSHAVTDEQMPGLPAAMKDLAISTDLEKDEILSAGIDLGRLDAMVFVATIADSAILSIYENVKKTKAWRGLRNPQSGDGRHFESLDEFCQVKLGRSYRRLREIGANRSALGEEAFEQAERLGLRQTDYNLIKALPAPKQEIIKEALTEGATKEELQKAIRELAAADQKEIEELTQRAEEAEADLEARSRVLEDKNGKIDQLTEELAKVKKRVKALPPADVGDEIRKEVTMLAAQAEVGIRAMRAGLQALADHTEAHGIDHGDFTAGLICQLELTLRQLRGEFDVKTAPDGDDTPEWMRPGASEAAAARVAADMAAAGWKRDAEGRMVRADAETTEA